MQGCSLVVATAPFMTTCASGTVKTTDTVAKLKLRLNDVIAMINAQLKQVSVDVETAALETVHAKFDIILEAVAKHRADAVCSMKRAFTQRRKEWEVLEDSTTVYMRQLNLFMPAQVSNAVFQLEEEVTAAAALPQQPSFFPPKLADVVCKVFFSALASEPLEEENLMTTDRSRLEFSRKDVEASKSRGWEVIRADRDFSALTSLGDNVREKALEAREIQDAARTAFYAEYFATTARYSVARTAFNVDKASMLFLCGYYEKGKATNIAVSPNGACMVIVLSSKNGNSLCFFDLPSGLFCGKHVILERRKTVSQPLLVCFSTDTKLLVVINEVSVVEYYYLRKQRSLIRISSVAEFDDSFGVIRVCSIAATKQAAFVVVFRNYQATYEIIMVDLSNHRKIGVHIGNNTRYKAVCAGCNNGDFIVVEGETAYSVSLYEYLFTTSSRHLRVGLSKGSAVSCLWDGTLVYCDRTENDEIFCEPCEFERIAVCGRMLYGLRTDGDVDFVKCFD